MESSADSERGLIERDLRHRKVASEPRVAGLARAGRAKGSSGPVNPGSPARRQQPTTLRVLISIEDAHRTYREAIGGFIRSARPLFEVRVVSPRGLQAELSRFGPQVVMYAGPPAPIPDLLPCWVELSLDPSLPTVLRTGGVLREVVNPSLGDVLAVIDQAAPVCP